MAIASTNPATGETLEIFSALSPGEIDERLQKASEAFEVHRLTSIDKRATCMRRASDLLLADKQRFAETMTLEMGKPIGQAIAEVEKCAWACRFYAEKPPTSSPATP